MGRLVIQYNKEIEKIIAVCKITGREFNDYTNKSGILSKHFKENFPEIEIPLGNRNNVKYYNEHGKFWFEDYFDFKIVPIKKERKPHPKTKFFTDEEVTEIIRIYREGEFGCRIIAEKFGCERHHIEKILKDNNIELFKHGQRFKGGKKVADKKYYEKNKEKIKYYSVKYREENSNKVKENHKKWRTDNEKYREYTRYKQRELVKSNPFYKFHKRFSTSLYTHLKENYLNKDDSCFNFLPYTKEELISHLERQFEEGMTWQNYGDWHLEHILPISSFKISDKQDVEFLKCWSLQNLKPLWGEDNLSKGKNYDLQLKKHYDLGFGKDLIIIDNEFDIKEITENEYDEFNNLNCWFNLKDENLIYYGVFNHNKIVATISLKENFYFNNKIYNKIFNFCVGWFVKNKKDLMKKIFDKVREIYGNICFLYIKYTFLDKTYFDGWNIIEFNKPIVGKQKLIDSFRNKDENIINLIKNYSYDSGHFIVYYK